MSKKILVTGGAGYIGSHTCKRLHEAGYEPIVYDNLVYGHKHAVKWGDLIVGDIQDEEKLRRVMNEQRPDAVVHFAAFAYVGESVEKPADYYQNNVGGTISLLNAMLAEDVRHIVFSSTCATYGTPDKMPITENTPQVPINPYGRTKLMIEQILADYDHAYGFKYAALRYFNAAGCDPDGVIGEEHEPETHLIPRSLLAALGDIPHLNVFGTDYDTPDGTCIRDYIHVHDLAQGHIKALNHIKKNDASICLNLGTGRGHSVREVLNAVTVASGKEVPVQYSPRRAGDPPSLFADISMARNLIGFEPEFTDLEQIVKTAWDFEVSRRSRGES